ncbi:cadherin-17 [Scleropages formosus]|uniref:cadherin-17 n=1 Tax=Scleropages formosus TaxID=113540 RepID=UPI0010FA8BB4|nr:cadherin-17 [Scleropages formosus]
MTLWGLLLSPAFLICSAAALGWEDKSGPLEEKTLDVPEGTARHYPIYQFRSSHPEVTSYQVSGDTNDKIAISTDGWLYLEKPLDWAESRQHGLQVIGVEDSGEPVDGPYLVTINVLDINNHQPTFNQTNYHGVVLEHSTAGVPFMRVFATDLDDPNTPNARLNYSIVSQIPDRLRKPLFQINSETGEISTTPEGAEHLRARQDVTYGRADDGNAEDSLKKKFDEYCVRRDAIPYELNPFFTCVERSEMHRMNPLEDPDYTLIVKAEDMEGQSVNSFSGNTRVNIAVKQNLWFISRPVWIRENDEGPYPMEIAKVQSNERGALYSLSQKERYPTFPFEIDEEGRTFVTRALDREEKETYVLVVFAKDEQDVELEKPLEIQVLVVDVNDNPPVCEELESKFEVQENEEIGSLIGVLKVYDLDEVDSPNSLLEYSLVSQEPQKPSANMFQIDSFTGKIQLTSSQLRRKDVPQYHLTVKVSDNAGDPSGYSTECKVLIRVIDINNEVPVFEKNDYGKAWIAEDTEVGATLITVLATDADDPGTGSSKVLYHIAEGDPEGTFAFESDEGTGEGRLYIARPLDYETKSFYTLIIHARNPEPLVNGMEYDERSTTVFIVNVTDVNEPPQFFHDIVQVTIPENVTNGETIVEMKAKDPEGKEIRFKLEGDEKKWLEIDAESGVIKSKGKLDREEVAEYKVRVTAYEKENPEQETQRNVTIRLLDVNDNSPTLMKTQSFVCAKKPQPVLLRAVDGDAPPFGEPFTFSLSKKAGANWEIRQINGSSANLVLKSIPREDRTVGLSVTVKDSAGMGVPQLVQVRVCNCTELGYCYIEPETYQWRLGLSGTLGIFGGILGFMGLIMCFSVYRMKNRRKEKVSEGNERDAMLQTM